MSSKRTPVQLPDFLQAGAALPHTGDVVPRPGAVPSEPVRSTKPPRKAATRTARPVGVAVKPASKAALAQLREGAITRLDVQVPVGTSNWLRDTTRPEFTGLNRSLGARTPASSLLVAAVELLAERGMDLSSLASADPDDVAAAFRVALEAAVAPGATSAAT